jgi:hypothetical protein
VALDSLPFRQQRYSWCINWLHAKPGPDSVAQSTPTKPPLLELLSTTNRMHFVEFLQKIKSSGKVAFDDPFALLVASRARPQATAKILGAMRCQGDLKRRKARQCFHQNFQL